MKKILCLVLFLSLFTPLSIVGATPTHNDNGAKKEILTLKQQISQDLSNDTLLHEKYYKHKLAEQQVKLLKLTTYNLIMKNHPKSVYSKQIREFVNNSFESSFIFPTLGDDHLDIFIMYQRWAEAETGYNPSLICTWYKGQKLKKYIMNKKGEVIGQKFYVIKYSSKDAGILQVNNCHSKTIKKPILDLYKSGTIPFKVKEVNKFEDLLDVNTNLVARSLIETDRKERGWEWKHFSHVSVDFCKQLKIEINNLKAQGLYDTNLVQNYYHLNPIKTYLPK